jgi:hypothetical protein
MKVTFSSNSILAPSRHCITLVCSRLKPAIQRQLRRLERRAPARDEERELTDAEYLQAYEKVLGEIYTTFSRREDRPPSSEEDKKRNPSQTALSKEPALPRDAAGSRSLPGDCPLPLIATLS